MGHAIRLATVDDAAGVLSIYAPFCEEGSFVSFEVVPPSIDEIRGRIARTLTQYPWLVCEADGEVLGYAYGYTHNERAAYRWSVNAGIYIGEGRRRSGIGRALYTSLFAALRLQGYVNVYAGITLPNPGSVALHQALGFEMIGVYRGVGYKSGAWRDVAWRQLSLRDRPLAPETPKPLPEVIGSPGWAEALASGLPSLRTS